jgi:hypothetical protein
MRKTKTPTGGKRNGIHAEKLLSFSFVFYMMKLCVVEAVAKEIVSFHNWN